MKHGLAFRSQDPVSPIFRCFCGETFAGNDLFESGLEVNRAKQMTETPAESERDPSERALTDRSTERRGR